MPLRTRTVNGQLWVKAHGEAWRPASASEETGHDTGELGAFGLGVASYPGNILEALKTLAPAAMPVTASERELTPAPQAVQAADQAAQFYPRSVLAGQMAPDLATMPLGMTPAANAMRAGTRGLSGMAQRVQAGIQQAGRSAAARAPRAAPAEGAGTGLDEFGLPVHQSAGAAATRTPRTLAERVTEEFTAPQPLTDQQVAARDAVTSGAVNFQPLPGQMQGSRLMLSAIKSNPMWLSEFEPELVANYREGARLIKQAMGIPDGTPMSDDMLDSAEHILGAKFNVVRNMVRQPIRLSPEAIEVAEPAMSAWQRRAIRLTEGEGDQVAARPLPAEEIFELRSRLNNQARELGRKGEINALEDVVRAVEEIDDAIGAQIGQEGESLWQEARNQWRVKLMVETTNAINKAGQVNYPTMANAAQKIFRKQYRGWGPRKGLPEPTQQLIDFIKVANAFPDAVGNSGTAERLVSMKAMTNPVEYLKQRATGRAIRFIADSTSPSPADAAAQTPAAARRFNFRVVRDGQVQSEHATRELAEKAARRLQSMSNGKLPDGTFTVEDIPE